MPEINELEDRERDPANIGSPYYAAASSGKPDDDAGKDGRAEADNSEEANPEAQSEDTETIDEFAESVILGLEHASLDLDVNDRPSNDGVIPGNGTGSADGENQDQTFFAGWGQDEPAQTETFPNAPSQAEAVMPEAFNYSERLDLPASLAAVQSLNGDTGTTLKHDALADAVQSALLSIYGTPSHTAGAAQGMAGSGFRTFASGSAELASAQNQAQFSEDLTPQDVILNYFNYGAAGSPETSPGISAAMESPRTGEASMFPQAADFPAMPVSGFPAGRHSGREVAQTQSAIRYEGPPSFPVPAAAANFKPRQNKQAQRESGRLLGAAGIGLVGGIAIAASLAVFTINSYGPQSQKPSAGGDPRQDGARGAENYGTAAQPTAPRVAPVANLPAPVAAPPQEVRSEIAAADVTASGGQPVPLAISVKSPRPLEQTLVSISGVPQGARLNAGVDAGGGNWLLPPRRLNGLTLSLPSDGRDSIFLEVELLESNARTPISDKQKFAVRGGGSSTVASLPASVQSDVGLQPPPVLNIPSNFNTQTVTAPKTSEGLAVRPPGPASGPFNTQTITVQPAAPASSANAQVAAAPSARVTSDIVPPASQAAPRAPTARPVPQLEIEDLIREGNKKMREGDIVKARELYLQAVNLGDADAALAMGRSFDPIYFERIANKNADADPAKAFEWYKRAMDGGAVQTARVRIENLKQHLNK